jgi:hypothetical protein
MSMLKKANRLVISMLLAAAACAVNAEVKLPDGNDWAKSTEREHIAYILGLSNTLSVGYIADEKRLPGNKNTFSHRAVEGLADTSVEEAVKCIDSWYKTHPGQLDTPIFKVLWNEIGEPRLAKSKAK